MSIELATRKNAIGILMLASALALGGCSELMSLDEPLEYPDAVGYFDRENFRQWWNELEGCSKLSRNLDGVGFFYVSAETLPSALHGIRTLGQYFPQSNRIFVVASAKSDRQVIRHEMMHALLRDESGHPPMYFGSDGLCGYL